MSHRRKALSAILLFAATSVFAAVPQSERDALLALYNATNGPSWKVKTGWNGAAGTECDWYGVQCNSDKSAVTDIDLHENSLNGALPSQIGSFPQLRSLAFYGNTLAGPLPTDIGKLTNLEELLVSECGLTGPIPSSIGSLSKLRNFSARSNKLTSIPREIGSVTAMVELLLGNNQFAGAIPSEIGNLPLLAYLDLSINGFTGSIPDSFASLKNLEAFSLEDNKCSGSLPSWLGSLPKLVDLRLSYNEFTGAIPPELGQLRNLTMLDLSWNQLSGAIPSQLGNLTTLERLWMNGNKFSGSIPTELSNLTNLVDLVLENCGLTGSIPPELAKLTKLQVLWLRRNQLTGSIPAEITQLPLLEMLGLGDNRLTGTIPAGVFRMPALVYIYIENNQLTGTIPTTMDAPNLRVIYASDNQLSGTIPTQLGNLAKLNTLDLSQNNLTGTIPPELSKTQIGELNLTSNQLSGTIPSVLGQLNLGQLRLAWNNLSGPIPPQIWSQKNMTYLALTHNALTGSIPSDIGNLTKLEYLFLSDNQLTGSIPSTIGNLATLNQLTLSGNYFSGPLPAEIWRLTALEVLEANDNSFTGTIPPEIGGLTHLRVLALGGNRFSGSLPAELGKLTNLQSLDVSSNQFSGTIPTQLVNLTGLVGLNVQYNAYYTSDPALSAFLDQKAGSPWIESQTLKPTNVAVSDLTDRSAVVTWTPIAYTWDEGGYQITATPRGSGTPVIMTSSCKETSSALVRGLQPSTTYDFTIKTVTHPHDYQQSLLMSESTTAVSGTTTAKVTAPADVALTATTSGLVQIGGVPQNDDAFVLSNFGDLPATLTLSQNGTFFTISPASFTLAGGASQTVTVKSVAGQATGTHEGYVVVPRDGDREEIAIDIRLLSVQRPSGTALAEAETRRVEIVGESGSDSVGSAAFRNRGTAAVVGMLVTDVPWLTTPSSLITIDPGSSYTANFTVARSKRPDAGQANGTVSGNLQLVYVDGTASTASLLEYRPYATTPGLSVTIVTVVDTVKPSVTTAGIPKITAGEVVRFIAGISTNTRNAEQFVSDLSIANAYGTKPIDDLRMYFTSIGSTSASLATFGSIAPARAVSVANVAKGVYAASSQTGTLQVRSLNWDRLLLHARTMNKATAGGSTGTAVPVFRSDRAAAPNSRIYLPGVRKSTSEHTNLYVQETSGGGASVQISFLDSNGTAVGTTRAPDSIAGYGLLELADGVPTGAVTAVVMNRSGSSGGVVAYAIVVDEKSGDTWTIVDWNGYYAFTQDAIACVPFVQSSASTTSPRRRAVGHAESKNTTDLTLYNSSSTSASLKLRYRDANDATGEQTIALAAGQTLTIADVARTLSSSAGAAPGYVTIEPLRGTYAASSRTYSSAAQGTIGTATPILAATSGLRLGQRQTFSAVDDSATTMPPAAGTQRTAVGLLETSGSAATIRANLLMADGKSPFSVTVSRDYTLRANQVVFVDSLAAALAQPFATSAWGDLHDLQLEFEVVSGSGAVMPFLLVTTDSGDTMMRVE